MFDVDIDDGEKVTKAMKAIKDQSDGLIKVPWPNLQLFLAKTDDGAWLRNGDPGVLELEEGRVHPYVQTMIDGDKMTANWTIKDELDANHLPTPQSKQIHVLVVVPEQEGTSNEMSVAPIPLTAEQTKMVVNEVLKERDEKVSLHSFSDLNTAMGERIVKKMRLKANIPDIKEPVDNSIGGYSWIPNISESEESQRAGYMAYLQQHLKTLMDRGDFLLDDIAGDESVLNIVDPRLPFAMKGTADVLLINRTSKSPLIKLAGVSLVIELKKKVEPGHVPQAIGQLVSCSMKASLNCYPLSLLTDLNDHWHFSWFSDNSVLTQVTLQYPKNAFRFIEAAVLRRTESAPLLPSFTPGPFKIIKVDDFLPQPDDAHAEEMTS
ncbi:hypothetical protein PR003_g26182 [Phytophthora rubi]|uniref:Crinkler effector protein N-terminal domain-containing protein n=2 Tax=Phytophthora rubi TaxID=129364 RepID=A0A6A4CHL9_9STRA|nr:hypothetical protein PR003_g26182 [Phytophthora rubi]